METLSDKIIQLSDKEGEDNWISCVLTKNIKELIRNSTDFDEEIKLTLIKIERRLESNDTDDWDIGLSLLRDLKKRFEEIRIEKDKLAGGKLI